MDKPTVDGGSGADLALIAALSPIKLTGRPATFWLSELTELKSRGVQDIWIACFDVLKGFPDAITVEYPQTRIQLCFVHMVGDSLRYVSWNGVETAIIFLSDI